MKKLLKYLMGLLMFFGIIFNVSAETIPIDSNIISIQSIIENFNNTTTVQSLNELGTNLSVQLDETNKKINIIGDDKLITSFNYTNEYIEFDNRSFEPTQDNIFEDLEGLFCIAAILEDILIISGYENMTIEAENESALNYEQHGIEFIEESYSFSGKDENGGEWSSSGSYLKYVKISLDKNKIDTLMKEFGIEAEDVNGNHNSWEVETDKKPVVSAREITNTSMVLYADIDPTEDEKDYLCEIYRSETPNGNYEKISFMVHCDGEVGVANDNLNPGTYYYYKAKVTGNNEFGQIISVKTLDKQVTNSTEQNNTNQNSGTTENPKTGISAHASFLLILVLAIVNLRFINKKNTVFKRI